MLVDWEHSLNTNYLMIFVLQALKHQTSKRTPDSNVVKVVHWNESFTKMYAISLTYFISS